MVTTIGEDNSLVSLKQIFPPKQLDYYGIALYLVDLCLTAQIDPQHWQLLDVNEQRRASRFHQHADKIRFVVTRVALKSVLAKRIDSQITDITFSKSEFGKLRLSCKLPKADKQAFNVSHSGNKSLIAVADADKGEIGVDIEQIQSFSHQEELKSYIYSKEELAAVSYHQLDKALLCQNWVMKEAVLKAVGCGLTYDMSSFSIIKHRRHDEIFKVNDIPSWSETLIWLYKYDEDYIAALAAMPK